MKPSIILAIGAVLVVLVLAWGPLSETRAKAKRVGECRDLRTRINILRTQGGDVSELERLQAALTDCENELRELGVDVDATSSLVETADGVRQQMQSEWAHFKATDYADILKRGATRATINRLGSSLAQTYRAALDASTELPSAEGQIDSLRAVLKSLNGAIQESADRTRCYSLKSPGCDRYFGSVEDSPKAKVEQERSMVREPLDSVRREVLDALATLGTADADDAADADAAAERDRLRQAGAGPVSLLGPGVQSV